MNKLRQQIEEIIYDKEHISIKGKMCRECKRNRIKVEKLLSLIITEKKDLENENIRLKSDIAHAIGFCRGLGHPEKYLEKQYPKLFKEK